MKGPAVAGVVLGAFAAALVHCDKATPVGTGSADAGAGNPASATAATDASSQRAATSASQAGGETPSGDARAPAAVGTNDAVLRAGWLAAGSTTFVVAEHGAYTFGVSDGGAASLHAPRCAFPPGASVLGVSSGGRIALDLAGAEKAGDVALLDVATCAVRRTGARASDTDPGVVPGGPPAGRLSDDGGRLVLVGDSDKAARVFDLPDAKAATTCKSDKAAGGADQEVELSADGAALVWRHNRVGTWVQPVAGCASSPGAIVSTSDGAFVSPHRRFLVVCPYQPFAGDKPVTGYSIEALPGGHVVGHITSSDLAAGDTSACSGAAAFSSDDGRFALVHAGRVHVFTLGDGHESQQIEPATLEQTLGEDPKGLAFSPAGDALVVWGTHRVVFFGPGKTAPHVTVDLRSPKP